MHMIGHDTKYIQLNVGVMTRQIKPRGLDDEAEWVQIHIPIYNITEYFRPSCAQIVTKYAPARV